MHYTKLLFFLYSILFFAKTCYTQEDTLKKENSSDISYITPKKTNANLGLIEAPEGFKPAEGFNGYLYLEGSAAIIMTLIEDVNYVKISEGMNEAYFTQNKLTKISDAKFVSNHRVKGQQFKLAFKLNDVDFVRIMVFAGDLKNTLWLNITYPAKFEELLGDEIQKTILSITLNSEKNEKK